MPSALREADRSDDEDQIGSGGLMFGLNCRMLRALCDNPWEGGGGYTPQEVALMTPDQAYFRLCDRKKIKGVKSKVSVEDAKMKINPSSGLVRGRLADGTIVERPLTKDGKSMAQLMKEKDHGS